MQNSYKNGSNFYKPDISIIHISSIILIAKNIQTIPKKKTHPPTKSLQIGGQRRTAKRNKKKQPTNDAKVRAMHKEDVM